MNPTRVLVIVGLLAAPLAQGAECAAPPVRNSQQAICYANAHAEKNRLPYRGASRKVSKSQKAWTVAYSTKKSDGSRGMGWEVDIDTATGTATRFTSFK